ncbi:MAG TPA: NUDIX hydrolase [Chloroflexota bacterium]|nr:NUDIX hydrolase [Chloroflexota bacterium]
MNDTTSSPTPNTQHPTPPITVAVGAIVTHGEQILLIQRGHPPGEGRWTIPGGRVEVDEALPEAVRREIQEECGIVVEPGQPAIMLDRLLRDERGALVAHYLIVDFWATAVGPERPTVAASSDARAAGWFTMEEIRRLPTTLNLLSYLEEAFRRRDTGGCLVVADND